MCRAIGCALIVGLICASRSLAAPQTWDYRGGGQWQQAPVAATNPSAPTSDPTLDRVEQLIASGRYDQAKDEGISWFKRNRSSPLADRALFLIAIAQDKSGNGIKAFYYFDQLLDEHPDSSLFATAMQKQYDIGDSYLRGRKMKFLGIPILGAEEEGVEIMYRVQQRAPSSPIAEKALLRTADFYFADRQYDLSQDAYGVFIRQYPRSPSVPRARLKQAYSAYALFHGPRFEITPIIDARERLATLMVEYPQISEQENIPAMLGQIDRAMSRKLYLTADFYRRTNELKAAAFNYRYLLRAYPDSDEAKLADARLKKLPSWALELPEPKVQQDTAALRTQPLPMPKVR